MAKQPHIPSFVIFFRQAWQIIGGLLLINGLVSYGTSQPLTFSYYTFRFLLGIFPIVCFITAFRLIKIEDREAFTSEDRIEAIGWCLLPAVLLVTSISHGAIWYFGD